MPRIAMNAPPTTPRPRRRWLQFSLRTLMLVVLMVSVPLGWFGMKVRVAEREDAAVDAIQALGGGISYRSDDLPTPAWIPRRHAVKVLAVFLGETQTTDADLGRLKEHLRTLPHMEELKLQKTRITDAGLEHLEEFTNLEELDLSSTPISDAGLVHLKPLSRLRCLQFTGSHITDDGLAHLSGLTQLIWLYLDNTQVTDAGVAELQRALPYCEIIR
jgi:hypothetical protein